MTLYRNSQTFATLTVRFSIINSFQVTNLSRNTLVKFYFLGMYYGHIKTTVVLDGHGNLEIDEQCFSPEHKLNPSQYEDYCFRTQPEETWKSSANLSFEICSNIICFISESDIITRMGAIVFNWSILKTLDIQTNKGS